MIDTKILYINLKKKMTTNERDSYYTPANLKNLSAAKLSASFMLPYALRLNGNSTLSQHIFSMNQWSNQAFIGSNPMHLEYLQLLINELVALETQQLINTFQREKNEVLQQLRKSNVPVPKEAYAFKNPKNEHSDPKEYVPTSSETQSTGSNPNIRAEVLVAKPKVKKVSTSKKM